MVKKLPANAGATGDLGLIPGCGRSPGVGNGNPLQYSFFFLIAHSSILAGIISGTEKPGRLQSIGSQRDWVHSTFPQNSHVEILTPKVDGIRR